MAGGTVEKEMVVVPWAALVAEDMAAVADVVAAELEVVVLVAVHSVERALEGVV